MAETSTDEPTLEAGGATIPRLGLGTWQNTGEQCAESVETALELGYRHVDTAQAYDNEETVGAGIAAAAVDRKDVFLTTKVWRGHLHHDEVIETVHESLDRLDVDYVDLLLIHGPHPRVPVDEPLGAMARLHEEGLVEHLGVSNFTRSQLRTAMEVADVPIVTNQVLYHPYKDQSALRAFCADNDVALSAYSPLARGAVLDDDTLASIGDRYDKSAAQVALRWLLRQDGVLAIPKATSREHIEQNRAVFDFELTDEEVARIDDLTPGLRRRLANAVMPAMMRWAPF
jgi:diketogulonate reductase-like aldo/keto reductase